MRGKPIPNKFLFFMVPLLAICFYYFAEHPELPDRILGTVLVLSVVMLGIFVCVGLLFGPRR